VVKGVGGTLVYPQAEQAVEGDSSAVVVEDAAGTVRLVDLRSRAPKVTAIGHAAADEEVGWLTHGQELLLTEISRNGTVLSMARGRRVQPLLSLNRYLSKVESPRQELISYDSGVGGRVLGRLWLPPGFRRGVRYPLIVYGYPDYVPGILRNPFQDLWMYPEVLLANAGYVVLQPSIPSRPNDVSAQFDPIVYYNRAVVAGVEAAVAQGYAEPTQVGYYGHSYGGYVGLALESGTHLFKAIVVVSPFANLIEMHDTAEPPLTDLSECTPSILLSASVLYEEAEGTVLDMGVPPWEDFARYARNSPYFNLRDATTPLLMEKGQFDGDLPAIRGVFSQLDRMGVPAELAVYWGEGHLLRTRGNVIDGWSRALRWLNRWVRDGGLWRDMGSSPARGLSRHTSECGAASNAGPTPRLQCMQRARTPDSRCTCSHAGAHDQGRHGR
jgi:dipeptidyl aminopeptidase/acylaminoacyl peptidase